MSLPQTKQSIVNQLTGIYDTGEALAIAGQLIEFYERKSNDDQSALDKINVAVKRLLQNEPLQYILGEAWFYDLTFLVNKNVLIPRPETEELVHLIINEIRKIENEISNDEFRMLNEGEEENQKSKIRNQKYILDIGTGSGCIPIALKKNIPEAVVYGMDISVDALSLAQQNAELNNVDVNFIEQDILTSNLQLPQFDIIVSNPPYITETEKNKMHENVLAYEPHLALFVTDKNPLQFYEAISVFAAKHLAAKGMLYFEINAAYGNEVKQCMERHGFTEISIIKDMQGKDRIVKGKLS
jgi:release factor glutamine methyltransferase